MEQKNEIIDIYKNDIVSNYDALINKYKKFIDEIKVNNELNKNISKYEKLISNLENDKHKFTNLFINKNYNIDVNTVNNFFESKYDNLVQKSTTKLKQMSSVKYSSKFKQGAHKDKMSRIQSRIKNLQNKNGKLQSIQKKIVNVNVSKYISTKIHELNNKYANYIKNNIQEISNKLEATNMDIMLDKMMQSLENRYIDVKDKVSSVVDVLKNKKGNVNLGLQHSKRFTKTL